MLSQLDDVRPQQLGGEVLAESEHFEHLLHLGELDVWRRDVLQNHGAREDVGALLADGRGQRDGALSEEVRLGRGLQSEHVSNAQQYNRMRIKERTKSILVCAVERTIRAPSILLC